MLFENVTANGTHLVPWKGGRGYVAITGTPGTATVSLVWGADGTTPTKQGAGGDMHEVNAAVHRVFEVPEGQVGVQIESANGSTNLSGLITMLDE